MEQEGGVMDELEVKPDERLRPCPFCGSAVAPYVGKYWNEATCNYEENQWHVVCNFNQSGCGGSSGVRDSEFRAIELWNRRADG